MDNELDKRQAETSPLSLREKAVVMRLLAKQLTHDKALNRLSDAGVELSRDFEFHVLELIADWYGVPADDTMKEETQEYHRKTGRYPKGTYCRGWILDEWEKVIDGDASPEDFVAVLCAESTKDAPSW